MLAKLDSTKKLSAKLGMSEWTDSADSMCEKENDAADFQPSKKRLKKLPSPKCKQDVCEIVSSEDQESILKDLYLNIWALLTFKPWITSQNECEQG